MANNNVGASARGVSRGGARTSQVSTTSDAPIRRTTRTLASSKTAKIQQQQRQIKHTDAVKTTEDLVESGYFEEIKTVEEYKAKYDAAPEVSKPFLITPQSVEDTQTTKLVDLQTKIDEKIATNEKYKQEAIDKYERQEQRYDERKGDLKNKLNKGKITDERYEEYLARAKIAIKEDEDYMEEKVDYRDAYNKKLAESKSKININVTPEWQDVQQDAYTYADYVRTKQEYSNELSQARYEEKVTVQKFINIGDDEALSKYVEDKGGLDQSNIDYLRGKGYTEGLKVGQVLNIPDAGQYKNLPIGPQNILLYNPETKSQIKVGQIQAPTSYTNIPKPSSTFIGKVTTPTAIGSGVYDFTDRAVLANTDITGIYTTQTGQEVGSGQVDITDTYTRAQNNLQQLYTESFNDPVEGRVKIITDKPRSNIQQVQVDPYTMKVKLEKMDEQGNIITETEDVNVYYNPATDSMVTRYGDLEFKEGEVTTEEGYAIDADEKIEEEKLFVRVQTKKERDAELLQDVEELKLKDALGENLPEGIVKGSATRFFDTITDASGIIPGFGDLTKREDIPEYASVADIEFASTVATRDDARGKLKTKTKSGMWNEGLQLAANSVKVVEGALGAFVFEAVPTVAGAAGYVAKPVLDTGAKYFGRPVIDTTKAAVKVPYDAGEAFFTEAVPTVAKYVAKPVLDAGAKYIGEPILDAAGKYGPDIIKRQIETTVTGARIVGETGKVALDVGAKYIGEPILDTAEIYGPTVIRRASSGAKSGLDLGAEYIGQPIIDNTGKIMAQQATAIVVGSAIVGETGKVTLDAGAKYIGQPILDTAEKYGPTVIRRASSGARAGTDYIIDKTKPIVKVPYDASKVWFTEAVPTVSKYVAKPIIDNTGYIMAQQATAIVVGSAIVGETGKVTLDAGAKYVGQPVLDTAEKYGPTVIRRASSGAKSGLDLWLYEAVIPAAETAKPYIESTTTGSYFTSSIEGARTERILRQEEDKLFGEEKVERISKAYEGVKGIIENDGTAEDVGLELMKHGYTNLDELNADVEKQQRFIDTKDLYVYNKKAFQEKVERGDYTALETTLGDAFYGVKPLAVPVVGGLLSLTPAAPIGTGLLVGYGGAQVGRGVEKLTDKYKSPKTILTGVVETAIGASFIAGPLVGGPIKAGVGKMLGLKAKTTATFLTRPQAVVKSLKLGTISGSLTGGFVSLGTYSDTKDLGRSLRAGALTGVAVGGLTSVLAYPKFYTIRNSMESYEELQRVALSRSQLDKGKFATGGKGFFNKRTLKPGSEYVAGGVKYTEGKNLFVDPKTGKLFTYSASSRGLKAYEAGDFGKGYVTEVTRHGLFSDKMIYSSKDFATTSPQKIDDIVKGLIKGGYGSYPGGEKALQKSLSTYYKALEKVPKGQDYLVNVDPLTGKDIITGKISKATTLDKRFNDAWMSKDLQKELIKEGYGKAIIESGGKTTSVGIEGIRNTKYIFTPNLRESQTTVFLKHSEVPTLLQKYGALDTSPRYVNEMLKMALSKEGTTFLRVSQESTKTDYDFNKISKSFLDKDYKGLTISRGKGYDEQGIIVSKSGKTGTPFSVKSNVKYPKNYKELLEQKKYGFRKVDAVFKEYKSIEDVNVYDFGYEKGFGYQSTFNRPIQGKVTSQTLFTSVEGSTQYRQIPTTRTLGLFGGRMKSVTNLGVRNVQGTVGFTKRFTVEDPIITYETTKPSAKPSTKEAVVQKEYLKDIKNQVKKILDKTQNILPTPKKLPAPNKYPTVGNTFGDESAYSYNRGFQSSSGGDAVHTIFPGAPAITKTIQSQQALSVVQIMGSPSTLPLPQTVTFQPQAILTSKILTDVLVMGLSTKVAELTMEGVYDTKNLYDMKMLQKELVLKELVKEDMLQEVLQKEVVITKQIPITTTTTTTTTTTQPPVVKPVNIIGSTPPTPKPPKLPNIRLPKLPPFIAFPWLDGEDEKKKKDKDKKGKQTFALTPDFTARALGLAPEKLTKAKAKKKARKIKTGLEIRTGVKIVDELDRF